MFGAPSSDILSFISMKRLSHAIKAADIAWIEWDAVCGEGWSEDALIIIPIVPKDLPRQVTWNVPFRDTSLVLWNRLPLPDGWTM